jgi:hypothetical protein
MSLTDKEHRTLLQTLWRLQKQRDVALALTYMLSALLALACLVLFASSAHAGENAARKIDNIVIVRGDGSVDWVASDKDVEKWLRTPHANKQIVRALWRYERAYRAAMTMPAYK